MILEDWRECYHTTPEVDGELKDNLLAQLVDTNRGNELQPGSGSESDLQLVPLSDPNSMTLTVTAVPISEAATES